MGRRMEDGSTDRQDARPQPVRLNIGCGEFPAEGWTNVDLTHPSADIHWNVTEGLPPVDGPIERIYAGHVLEHIEYDDIPTMLELWLEHPQVSVTTLMAVVGPDCDTAEKWLRQGKLTDEQYHEIRYGGGRWVGDDHLWRSTGVETATMLRESGWAPAQPYDLQMLVWDGWPVTSLIGWQFGALCRAIK